MRFMNRVLLALEGVSLAIDSMRAHVGEECAILLRAARFPPMKPVGRMVECRGSAVRCVTSDRRARTGSRRARRKSQGDLR